MNLTSRKLITTIFVAIVGNTLLSVISIWLFISQIKPAFSNVRDLEQQRQQLEGKVEKARDLSNKLVANEKNLNLIADIFFENEEIVPFIELIEEMAKKHNLGIIISSAQLFAEEKSQFAKFSFSLNGDFKKCF